MHGFYGMGLGMTWISVISIVFLAMIIWLVVKSYNQRPTENQTRSALDVLKERYARGEINKQEFEEMKETIM